MRTDVSAFVTLGTTADGVPTGAPPAIPGRPRSAIPNPQTRKQPRRQLPTHADYVPYSHSVLDGLISSRGRLCHGAHNSAARSPTTDAKRIGPVRYVDCDEWERHQRGKAGPRATRPPGLACVSWAEAGADAPAASSPTDKDGVGRAGAGGQACPAGDPCPTAHSICCLQQQSRFTGQEAASHSAQAQKSGRQCSIATRSEEGLGCSCAEDALYATSCLLPNRGPGRRSIPRRRC